MSAQLQKPKHTKYLKRLLQIMPTNMSEYDSNRLLMAYFAISGLDILNSLDEIDDNMKYEAIDWIYSLQVKKAGSMSGFQACTMIPKDVSKYQCGHLTMTYTGLVTLLILGDDLSRVDKKSIVEGMRACQNPDGSFTAMVLGCESDMRFLYCACCVSAILNDWSGIDKTMAINYILESISYDGAIGQGPGLESHGGSTFCAIASLFLMNELNNVLTKDHLNRLRRWCLMRQDGGFHGRPGKPSDTCYSFWVGATLQLLDINELSDTKKNKAFLLEMQDVSIGGFAKSDNNWPDPLHTYLSLCGLSLSGEAGLLSMNPALNISQRAYEHLQEIHNSWQREQFNSKQMESFLFEFLPKNTTTNSEVHGDQLDKFNDALEEKRPELKKIEETKLLSEQPNNYIFISKESFLFEFLPKNTTTNSELYGDQLNKFNDALEEKRPELKKIEETKLLSEQPNNYIFISKESFLFEFLPKNTTTNSELYGDQLNKFNDALEEKRPELKKIEETKLLSEQPNNYIFISRESFLFEFLPKNTTTNSEVYGDQLDKFNDALKEKRSELKKTEET